MFHSVCRITPGYTVDSLGFGTHGFSLSIQSVPGSKWDWVGPLEYYPENPTYRAWGPSNDYRSLPPVLQIAEGALSIWACIYLHSCSLEKVLAAKSWLGGRRFTEWNGYIGSRNVFGEWYYRKMYWIEIRNPKFRKTIWKLGMYPMLKK